jgi:hypothetical protein
LALVAAPIDARVSLAYAGTVVATTLAALFAAGVFASGCTLVRTIKESSKAAGRRRDRKE